MRSSTGQKYEVNRAFVVGVIFVALFIVTDIAVAAGTFESVDVRVFTLINGIPPSWVDSVMVSLSLYGREIVWGGLVLVLFLAGGEREKKAALTMCIVFLALTGVGYSVKFLTDRARPYDVLQGVRLLVPEEADSGFPSGHTLIVISGAVVAWFTLRKRYASILTVEACLVSYSRIYVGVHFPSDVVGGALLGAGFAFILCSNLWVIDRFYRKISDRLAIKR